MHSASGAPVAFVVPQGYSRVDFYFGAVEVNPCIGVDDDLECVVTLGEPKIATGLVNGALHGGDQVTVTLPWRYAPWVELAPEHLRVAVTARFSAGQGIQPL